LKNADDNSAIVYLKLGLLLISVVVVLYAADMVPLVIMNAAIVLVCLLFSDLFGEILAVVLRIAIGFPFLLLVYVISECAVSGMTAGAFAAGALGAAVFILKIHFVVWANLLFVRTTEPQQLVPALEKLHMPRELCLMIVIILRFFPVMFEEATAVYQAQRVRGFEFRRAFNPANWLPLTVPLVVNVMKKSHDLAMILELKGILKAK
jgi:energy-coupling factor transporter transmembrane protein EcfT